MKGMALAQSWAIRNRTLYRAHLPSSCVTRASRCLEIVQCNILALNLMHAHVHMHETNRHSAQLAVCK